MLGRLVWFTFVSAALLLCALAGLLLLSCTDRMTMPSSRLLCADVQRFARTNQVSPDTAEHLVRCARARPLIVVAATFIYWTAGGFVAIGQTYTRLRLQQCDGARVEDVTRFLE